MLWATIRRASRFRSSAVVGYLPDTVGFYDHMTARDNLRYTAALIGIELGERDERIAAALERVDLPDVEGKKG